jgi:DNA-binding transcriptional ArsR family regulator
VFGAVADPTRRAILDTLARGEVTVGELAARFPISLNGVSKHIRVLERAGLITRDVRGREHRLTFDARPLEDAAAWMERYRAFWESRLDALEGPDQVAQAVAENQMSTGGPGALVVRRIIRASREEIFDMWTEADNLRLWMRPPRASGASAESDPRVGGRYRDRHARRSRLRPPRRIPRRRAAVEAVVHLGFRGQPLPDVVVTVELFDRGGGQTELILTHERLPVEEVGPP